MTADLLHELELSDDLNAACKRKGVIGGSYLHIDLASGTVLRHELWIAKEPEEQTNGD